MTTLSPSPPISRPSAAAVATAPELPGVLKRYASLVKPGILLGNTLSVTGGVMLGTRGRPELPLFPATIVGLGLVVAAACVVNNCIDRDIDKLMVRTRRRVLVTGEVAPEAALAFAAALGSIGLTLLAVVANFLATALAALGFVVYVGAYSLWLKRRSVHATAVGSISGAMPPVVGYCAASGHFDPVAALLLGSFALWQMPHSNAIAILRLEDYVAAGIPVHPAVKGVAATKRQSLYYVAAFAVTALALVVVGAVGSLYAVGVLGLCLTWFGAGALGVASSTNHAWARRMFLCSIVVVSALSVLMAVDATAAGTG